MYYKASHLPPKISAISTSVNEARVSTSLSLLETPHAVRQMMV